MIKEIIPTGKTGNVIVTIAIGQKYLNQWENYAKENWISYCNKREIGLLIVTEDLILKENEFWKIPNWQKMLLGTALKEFNPSIKNVCYLDTDFLINVNAPCVFKNSDLNKINLVSLFNHLPFNLNLVKKRIAYFRHHYYNPNYPLDSSLFMNIKEVCDYHNKDLLYDMSCSGFFVFNIEKHAVKLENCFFNYKKDVKSITNGGDQFHFNYEVMNNFEVNWLDYKYQAIWLYEMAAYYPYLYLKDNQNNFDWISKCIQTSLTNNYFLHFAGSWNESHMWLLDKLMNDYGYDTDEFDAYLNKQITPKPVGSIKPQ